MRRVYDRVIIDGKDLTPAVPARQARPHRPFLAIWYRCCHAYGRLYRNRDETAYEGRCPRCGAGVRARIGAEGTDRRLFEAR